MCRLYAQLAALLRDASKEASLWFIIRHHSASSFVQTWTARMTGKIESCETFFPHLGFVSFRVSSFVQFGEPNIYCLQSQAAFVKKAKMTLYVWSEMDAFFEEGSTTPKVESWHLPTS